MTGTSPRRLRARSRQALAATFNPDLVRDAAALLVVGARIPRDEADQFVRLLASAYQSTLRLQSTMNTPAKQMRKELRAYRKRLLAVRDTPLSAATVQALYKGGLPGPWLHSDGLPAIIDRRLSAVDRALVDTPRPRGGRSKDDVRTELVKLSYQAFDVYRPGDASATQSGDFITFVERVHEIATGQQESFDWPVKRFFAIHR